MESILSKIIVTIIKQTNIAFAQTSKRASKTKKQVTDPCTTTATIKKNPLQTKKEETTVSQQTKQNKKRSKDCYFILFLLLYIIYDQNFFAYLFTIVSDIIALIFINIDPILK